MSANNENNNQGAPVHSTPVRMPEPAPAVYTVCAEPPRGNVNYGFHASHPQAPPPKYEDVISGRPIEQPSYTSPPAHYGVSQQEVIPTRVILVADPGYKYSRVHRGIALLFMVIFLIAFISVLTKIFGSMRR